MSRRKLSPRAERRAAERAAEKIARGRERLARLEAGGDASRPVVVESASQVEPHALALSCLRCAGPLRLDEHTAETHEGQRLRLARLKCPRCGAPRLVWFQIRTTLPS